MARLATPQRPEPPIWPGPDNLRVRGKLKKVIEHPLWPGGYQPLYLAFGKDPLERLGFVTALHDFCTSHPTTLFSDALPLFQVVRAHRLDKSQLIKSGVDRKRDWTPYDIASATVNLVSAKRKAGALPSDVSLALAVATNDALDNLLHYRQPTILGSPEPFKLPKDRQTHTKDSKPHTVSKTYTVDKTHKVSKTFKVSKTHKDGKAHTDSKANTDSKIHAENKVNTDSKTHAESKAHKISKTHQDSKAHIDSKTNTHSKTHTESKPTVTVKIPLRNRLRTGDFNRTPTYLISYKTPTISYRSTLTTTASTTPTTTVSHRLTSRTITVLATSLSTRSPLSLNILASIYYLRSETWCRLEEYLSMTVQLLFKSVKGRRVTPSRG